MSAEDVREAVEAVQRLIDRYAGALWQQERESRARKREDAQTPKGMGS